jgi:hypothetical protein
MSATSRTALFLLCLMLGAPLARAQEPKPASKARCKVDLKLPGQMGDILSNALLRGLRHPEREVSAFLSAAKARHDTGKALLKAAAAHFKVKPAILAAEVERFRHCNCNHEGATNPGSPAPGASRNRKRVALTVFARDVALHVALHEIGHGLIREFDLPVLGNEETNADAFATHFLTTHLPDRALDVLSARVRSLMIEAREVPRAKWTVGGEHNSDARRAHQIAALAVAADPKRYAPVAAIAGMSAGEVRKARDYGTEIHRSWRRVLAPLWMPPKLSSNEARLTVDGNSAFADQLRNNALTKELRVVLRRFDWHSQVTLRFAQGDGGGGWSRSKRTITIHDGYLRRFVRQGRIAAAAKKRAKGQDD